MHFLKHMKSQAPDPIKTGSTESWFRYYKWQPGEDEEVFFPLMPDECEDIATGDHLWFALDDKLVGCAVVDKVMFDPFNALKEIWYNMKHCREVMQPVPAPADEYPDGLLPSLVGVHFMETVKA